MRRLARIPICLAAVALLCASTLASAQTDEMTARLHRVVVWIVSPQNDANPLALRRRVAEVLQPPQYQESTAGDFGHTAGSTGKTAGSVGSTMGNFGQTAGSTGQTAGSAGKTSGDFGRSASTVGQNAGDAGTTMANFGTSTSDLARVAAARNGLIPKENQPRRSYLWNAIVESAPFDPGLSDSAPQALSVTYVDVYHNDLEALLETVAGTVDMPDVLLGDPLPREWSREDTGVAGRYGVAPLWHTPHILTTEGTSSHSFEPEAALLANALNPDGARGFCLWLLDRDSVAGRFEPTPATEPLAQLAIRAMLSLLAGASLDADADAEMAQVNGQLAAASFAGARTIALEKVKVHAEIARMRIFGDLAFVAVRASGTSAETFGVAHALVVLRRDDHAHWRVLQVSPDLDGRAQSAAWATLTAFSSGPADPNEEGSIAHRNEGKHPLGVALATPKEGAILSPQPELWWDNLGGATLQAVEWQTGAPESGADRGPWSASNLFFVPDNGIRLRTRAVARFASAPGVYRWRVWSLGKGGELILSPWRTMKIVPS